MTGRIELWHDGNLVKSLAWKNKPDRKIIINQFKKLIEHSWLSCYMVVSYSQNSFDYAAKKRDFSEH